MKIDYIIYKNVVRHEMCPFANSSMKPFPGMTFSAPIHNPMF